MTGLDDEPPASVEDGDGQKDLLVDALTVSSSDSELISAVFAAANSSAQAEETLRSGIDSRAAAQVTASGVSLTVGATVATVLLKTAVGPTLLQVVTLYVLLVALGCAVFSVSAAVRAMRVGKWRALNYESVFVKHLTDAKKNKTPPGRLIYWRSTVARTLAVVAMENEKTNERRLRDLGVAQDWYRWFLVVFVATLVLIAVGATVTMPE
jgi:hypothetical protein